MGEEAARGGSVGGYEWLRQVWVDGCEWMWMVGTGVGRDGVDLDG